MAGRSPLSLIQVSDANGTPISGAKMNHYATGTTTPQDTYSDDDLTSANANPVVADSEGRFGDIFFLASTDYKVVLTDADDVTIFTADPVRAPSPKASTIISKSTTYTVTSADDGKLIAADATGGAFTITLPAAATAGDGFEIAIIKIDSSSNAVTIDGDGSETINDSSSQSLSTQFDAIEMRSDASEWYAPVAPASSATPLPQEYINGLVISNNGTDADHDIDISTGVCRDDGDEANMSLSSTLTKRIDAAWAVGDGNGGLDTGAVASTTDYFIWLIRRSDTGVVDALFSTSGTSPTMPTNYDQKRLIGWVSTDGSSNILGFQAYESAGGGLEFAWDDPPLDVDLSNSLTTSDRSDSLSVPSGISVVAHVNVYVSDAADSLVIVRNPDINDEAPSASAGPLATFRGIGGEANAQSVFVRTNTSSQVSSRASVATIDTYRISTLGFEWSRR